MKYLVTGGCGFLGSNLSERILKDGDELIIFDNLSKMGSEKNLDKLKSISKFQFIKGDVRDREAVDKIIIRIKPDIIFHAAGQIAMTTSLNDPKLDFDTNALGTFNLLNAVKTHSKNSVILFSSSNKVYGEMEYIKYIEGKKRYTASGFKNGFDESLLFDPVTPYGVSKAVADMYMRDFHRMYGLKTVVFRHSSMYGGYQHPTYDQGWIGWFCRKAIEIKDGKISSFKISGNGKQVRDVLYASDVVELYMGASANIDKCEGQFFNIGGGMANSLSLLELFDLLEKETGANMNFETLPTRISDQKIFVADNSKIRRALGWQPKINKEEGIRNTLKWLSGTEIKNG